MSSLSRELARVERECGYERGSSVERERIEEADRVNIAAIVASMPYQYTSMSLDLFGLVVRLKLRSGSK
jgi:hypothetical protein